MSADLTPERLAEIKALVRNETSIAFYSGRAKESVLLLIAEVDRQRAEVIAERDAQIIAWLLKKSREYGVSNRENRAKAEAVWRMADKLSRGAVRDTEATS